MVGQMLPIRLILGSITCIFAIHCACAVPVSLILDDSPGLRDGSIVHELTAYEGLSNVTIVDYFLEVEAEVNTTSEEFLGRQWYRVEIPAGDMQKGQIKTVTYKISSAAGDALLGADVYSHSAITDNRTLFVNTSLPDTTPPIVTLQSPPNGTTNNDGFVNFTYMVYDASHVVKCTLDLNGTPYVDAAITIGANSFAAEPEDGTYSWNVSCCDANNTGLSQTRTLTVNITAFSVTLAAGWNLFSLPLNPGVPYNASSLLNLTQCTIISKYDHGLQTYIRGGAFDFPIELRRGYYLFCPDGRTFTIEGSKITEGANLSAGWNLIGLNERMNVGRLLTELSLLAVAKYDEGFVVYTEGSGNDFNITRAQGVFVYEA